MKICSISGCNKKHKAKGYCHNHYENFKRTGNPIPRTGWGNKCLVDKCEKRARARGYCSKHYVRLNKYGDVTIKNNLRGEKHPHWKGGIAEYRNHSLMKRNRKIKFEQLNYICERCNANKTEIIHHVDLTKYNHELNNLMGLCKKCHFDLHKELRKGKRKTENIKEYQIEYRLKKYAVI